MNEECAKCGEVIHEDEDRYESTDPRIDRMYHVECIDEEDSENEEFLLVNGD